MLVKESRIRGALFFGDEQVNENISKRRTWIPAGEARAEAGQMTLRGGFLIGWSDGVNKARTAIGAVVTG